MLTTITLSPAQVQGLYAAALPLMAAPGAGKVIKVNSITQVLDYNGTAFALGGVLTYQYSSGGANVLGTGTFAATTLTGSADTVVTRVPLASSTTAAIPQTANLGVELVNATAAFTGGGTTSPSQVKVIIDFNIVKI